MSVKAWKPQWTCKFNLDALYKNSTNKIVDNPFIFAVEVVLSGCNMKPFHVMYVYCIPSWTRLSCKTAVADQIYSKPFLNRIWISRYISKILIYSKLKIRIKFCKIRKIIKIETSKTGLILHCDQAEFCHSFISRGPSLYYVSKGTGDWGQKNGNYCWCSVLFMLTYGGWLGGSEKVQKFADVI